MNDYYPEYMSSYDERPAHFNNDDWEKEVAQAFVKVLIGFFSVVITIAVIAALCGCSPKVTEQHHYHTEAVDTLSVQRQIDNRLQSFQQRTDSIVRQSVQKYSASWFSHEGEKERTTEVITTFTDSLGRAVTQQQRTTERSLSRMQQQTEERLTQEWEQRLSVVADSLNNIWQERFNAAMVHKEQKDSTDLTKKSGSDNSYPWYKRLWSAVISCLSGIAIAIIAVWIWIWRNK